MKLVQIPAGEFTMGTSESAAELVRAFPEAKAEYFDDERPAHRVRITRPFYLGQYEVTLGQFLTFYHAAKYKCECERDGKGGWGWDSKDSPGQKRSYTPWSWGHTGQTMNHPVVNVTWNDATAFCEWLSKKEGHTYRLPTEAEWEYACRAGTRTRYYNGDNPEGLTLAGNVADATAKARWSWMTAVSSRDGYELTAPVGRFEPNGFGLHDMHGNVWEWCADWYDKEYYTGSPVDDPQGPSGGSDRVFRGGSWFNLPQDCRSAYRLWYAPSYRSDRLGFRVAYSPR